MPTWDVALRVASYAERTVPDLARGMRMLRNSARMLRLLSVSGAAVTVGMGILAMPSAASAAPTSGLRGAESARATAIGGDWEGRYTCAQGLTGLDLRIKGPGRGGSLSATFSRSEEHTSELQSL